MKLNFRHSRLCRFVVSIFLLATFALSSVSNSHALMHGPYGEKSITKTLLSLGAECDHGQNRDFHADHADFGIHHSSNDSHEYAGDCGSEYCVPAIIVDEPSKIKLEVAKTKSYWRSLQIVRSESAQLHRPPNS